MDGTVTLLVALQFAAFGWRINREITVGDEERRTWFPVADYVNVIMLFLTISCCIVIPLVFGSFGTLKKMVLVAAAILLAFHPITTAGHYGLITKRGREYYADPEEDYPYTTREEIVCFVISIIITAFFVLYIYKYSPSI